MKKVLFFVTCFLITSSVFSQDLESAVMFANSETQGTARFKAMSGAFGALGGDMSGISINPAGAAIFNASHGSFTASTITNNADVRYGNTINSDSSLKLDMDQIGAAFVFKSYKKNSSWNKLVISVFYEKLQNFNKEFSAIGITNSSVSSYFLQNANGLQLANISALDGETLTQAYSAIGSLFGYQHQQAFLGYNSYILEPEVDEDQNTIYESNIAPGSFSQQYDYLSLGNSGKLTANLAYQYGKNIYFGLNLNSHFIDYEKSTHMFEENSNPGSLINNVNFQNKLYTSGEGFSFQLGTIMKIFEKFRIGLSYESPRWLTLREETTQYLATSSNVNNLSYLVNPSVVNIFPEYNLRTPGKIITSIAYVMGKSGLISFDYSNKNYSNTSFDTGDTQLDFALNNSINSNLTTAKTYRVGGEIRKNNLSLRGGYKMEESPYKNTNIFGNLNGYSLGLGYNFGNTRIDLSYENNERFVTQNLYNNGSLEPVLLDLNNSIFSFSLAVNL